MDSGERTPCDRRLTERFEEVSAYLFRRLIGIVPVVLIGATLIFILVHLAPGDPATIFLDPNAAIHTREQIGERFGLDQSVATQYLKWLFGVIFHFDFGNSFTTGRPATEMIVEALEPTLILTVLSLILGIFIGIILGIYAAAWEGRAFDKAISAIMLFFYSMPSFLIGVLLLGLFAVRLDWLPSSQMASLFHNQLSFGGRILDSIRHLILPVTTLGISFSAVFFKYIRGSMVESLHSNYILAARARGVESGKIFYKYALRNSLLPFISTIGLTLPMLFSGALIIEIVFSLPGMGRVMFYAALARDYPVIIAAGSLAFFSVVVGNLLADVFYVIADPRIRLKGRSS